MNFPTRNQFRLLSLGAFTLIGVGTFMDATGNPRPTPEEIELMKLNGSGLLISIANYQTLTLMIMGAVLIGAVTFIGFWKWSRYLLIGSYLLTSLLLGVQGVIVTKGLSEAFYSFGGILLFFPLVLSFFPPCSHYFEN